MLTKREPIEQTNQLLKEALKEHLLVKIRYKGAWRTINPYSVDSTYVVSYCNLARDIRTFRIDKIQNAVLSDPFVFDKSIYARATTKLREAPSYSYRRR